MDHNLLVSQFTGARKLTKPMLIQLGVIVVLFILTLVIGLDAYGSYTKNNNLNNALDKYNERNYKRSREFFDKVVSEDSVIKLENANFHQILAFLNGDIENARKFNNMLENESEFADEYTIGNKLLWSVNPEPGTQTPIQIVVDPKSGNAVVSNGYSYLHRGEFQKAYDEFQIALRRDKENVHSAPTRDACVAAYNGAALALIGKIVGKLDGSKTLEKLSLFELEFALSSFRSAQMYSTPYAPVYYNYDRLYAAYMFRYLHNESSFDVLKSIVEKAKNDMNINLENPESSNNHFDKINAKSKWFESSEQSQVITRSSTLPINSLWKHRIKITYHAFACMLADMSAKAPKDLKYRYDLLSEKFWQVIFKYYPEVDYYRTDYFVCKLKTFKSATDKKFRKICAENLHKILESDIDQNYMSKFNKSKLEKLKTVIYNIAFMGK